MTQPQPTAETWQEILNRYNDTKGGNALIENMVKTFKAYGVYVETRQTEDNTHIIEIFPGQRSANARTFVSPECVVVHTDTPPLVNLNTRQGWPYEHSPNLRLDDEELPHKLHEYAATVAKGLGVTSPAAAAGWGAPSPAGGG